MPELSFTVFLNTLAASIAALWLTGFVWTWYCLRKQLTLKPDKNDNLENEPFISILVPARNEADRILEKSIGSMLEQTYKNFEIIVLNDRSTDNTKEILKRLKFQIPDSKFQIVDGIEPHKTWLGKPHALHQAFQKSSGEWILSTDADIVFAPETLQTVVNYAETNRLDALTLIPKYIYASFWEKLFMPVFGWFCVLAMPLHRVNNPNRKEFLGIGNFFMFRREVLEKIGGFESVKSEVGEDLKLAEILKKSGFKLRIDYAPDLLETRMYSGFREIWEGFTKNLFAGMKFSPVKSVFGAISILLFGVLPVFFAFLAFAFGQTFLFIAFFTAYILQVFVLVLINREWQVNLLYAFLTPIGLALFAAILMNSMVKVLSGEGVTWKGRAIYEKDGVRPPLK